MASNADNLNQLRALERQLDEHHESLPLWSFERGEAINGVLAQFDQGFYEAILGAPSPDVGMTGAMLATRQEDFGVDQSLKWLTDGGRNASQISAKVIPSLLPQAADFATHAAIYANICDFYILRERGLIEATADLTRRRIRFVWPDGASESASLFLGVEESLRAQVIQHAPVITEGRANSNKIRHLIKMAVPTIAENRFFFANPVACCDSWFTEMARRLEHTEWDLVDDTTELHGFTVGAYRKFWGGLRTWSLLLGQAYVKHTLERHVPRIDRPVPTQFLPIDEFTGVIAKLTGLCSDTIQQVVDLLKYDDRTSTPDFFQQPFFVVDKTIHWSPRLCLVSSYMRNLLKLMSRTPSSESHAATIIGSREKALLKSLGLKLQQRGKCSYRLTAPYEVDGEQGDIDLLAYNSEHPDAVLVAEGKAVLDVDEINEVAAATKAIGKGKKQAEGAVRALKKMPETMRSDLFRFVDWSKVRKFYAIVFTPNSEPHQDYDHSEIPAISLATITAKFHDSQYRSPLKFWERCRTRPWVKKPVSEVRTYKAIHVAGITFEVPIVVRVLDPDR